VKNPEITAELDQLGDVRLQERNELRCKLLFVSLDVVLGSVGLEKKLQRIVHVNACDKSIKGGIRFVRNVLTPVLEQLFGNPLQRVNLCLSANLWSL